MAYFTEEDIQNRVNEHVEAFKEKHPDVDWFVCCAQGSMNYGLFDENSDVDTKMLTLPTLTELVLEQKPLNYTLVLENDEHCDVKDVRTYFKTFRKQNINFVEILYTPYWVVNEAYLSLWMDLLNHREELVHMNPYAAVSCMLGMSREKRHALTHKYPSKRDTIEKFGYDPKQLHHLWRLNRFIKRYIAGKSYEECLYSSLPVKNVMMDCKRDGCGLSKEDAEKWADEILAETESLGNNFRSIHENKMDEEMDTFLNSLLEELVTQSLTEQLEKR